ncbi:MAG: TerC family protein [Acidobacteriota bacterium]|nr:TerC family protein [Acidobacteriota bacterium]
MLIALLTLTVLEIVLGIDNIIFISILSGKLPKQQQKKARQLGLILALVTRIALLFSLSWLIGLTEPLFAVLGQEFSGRDLILGLGGLFLLGKATLEIHEKVQMHKDHKEKALSASSFANVLFQIMLLDIVFSLDSVITAVGMVDNLTVMVTAVVISVIFMLIFVNPISNFVDRNPTVKVLALAFLMMIGLTLIGEAWEMHIPKGYVYFAMAFSVFVEMINLRVRKVSEAKK